MPSHPDRGRAFPARSAPGRDAAGPHAPAPTGAPGVREPDPPSAEQIDALLPQTQCTRCGYPGCRPYAEAIARGEAEFNQCPPGGAATLAALAKRLGRTPLPLNPAHGIEGPPRVARIDEQACIGCARCLPPCPVDAIVGAHKLMHTVVTARCTGCELCLAPCPVDCISMVPRVGPEAPPGPQANRRHFAAHAARTARRADERARLLASRKRLAGAAGPGPNSG